MTKKTKEDFYENTYKTSVYPMSCKMETFEAGKKQISHVAVLLSDTTLLMMLSDLSNIIADMQFSDENMEPWADHLPALLGQHSELCDCINERQDVFSGVRRRDDSFYFAFAAAIWLKFSPIKDLRWVMQAFGIDARAVKRNKNKPSLLTFQDGSQIEATLSGVEYLDAEIASMFSHITYN